MSFRVGEFTCEGEKEFVLGNKDWGRVNLQVWDRTGEGGRREVAVTSGSLSKTGKPRDGGFECVIVDRDKFVEGLLAVFPELIRKPKFATGGYIPDPAPWAEIKSDGRAYLLNPSQFWRDLGMSR